MSMSTLPGQVLIIRHAEKIGDPKKDNDGGRHLSIRGSARAAALPSLFTPAMPQTACKLHHHHAEDFHGTYREVPVKGTAPRFTAPQHIFATQGSKDSKRPTETVAPLATALKVPVQDGFADNAEDIKKMTDAVLHEYPGQVVLICWHHSAIPDIAKALGVRPPKWDGKIFDRVWQITFPKGKATLTDSAQMLLYGDSSK
jgi:hypothetical protein